MIRKDLAALRTKKRKSVERSVKAQKFYGLKREKAWKGP